MALADRAWPALAVIVSLVALTGCGVRGLSFREDDRVDILEPGDRKEVRLPVRIDWTVTGFDVGPGHGSFGVLVDQAPQRPGKTLAWLFRGDDSCRGDTGKALCEQADFLASRRAYRTTDSELTLEQIPRLSGDDRGRQFHEVTVVLLDEDGRRVGEGAWSVQFELPRER